MSLWLPDSWEGGSPGEDLKTIIEGLKALGPKYAQAVRLFEQNPEAFAFLAIDTELGDSGYPTTVTVVKAQVLSAMTIEVYTEAISRQLPSQFTVVEKGTVSLNGHPAGRIVVDFVMQGVSGKEILYLLKVDNTIWAVTFAAVTEGTDDFDQRLPIFEQSVRTFRPIP